MGEMVHQFTSPEGKTFEVYKCSESTPRFRDYHERLQAWIMFYIDAASFIDIEDDAWRIFILFQKTAVEGGEFNYSVAGYMTVYQYYAYDREKRMIRPRIGQMLILPPFQRQGLGSALLNTLYRNYQKDSSVVDITVEDPSDNFVRLRDYVDTLNCLALPAYSEAKVLEGYTSDMAKAAALELNLCKKQARRVYEIIRLKYSSTDALYQLFRKSVKHRLNAPYQREQSQLEKLRRALKPEEFNAAMVNITDREQRLEMLNKQFLELEAHYKKVLHKIQVTA